MLDGFTVSEIMIDRNIATECQRSDCVKFANLSGAQVSRKPPNKWLSGHGNHSRSSNIAMIL